MLLWHSNLTYAQTDDKVVRRSLAGDESELVLICLNCQRFAEVGRVRITC